MTDQSPPQDLSEEVAFWRGFIERWARERDGPVPPRAWEALNFAENQRGARELGTELSSKEGVDRAH